MAPEVLIGATSTRYTVFFDIDNTLYPASSRISQAMGQRIHEYFVSIGLSHEEASQLHHRYYNEYGLALRGLVRHHRIDPLDFNEKCDGSLPLEEMIKPDPSLRSLLSAIDRTKARVWALTNAYKTHAMRVLSILGLEDLIEGVIYCDYAVPNFSCKPEATYYHAVRMNSPDIGNASHHMLKALAKANVTDPAEVLFVDDSLINVRAAGRLGWGSCVWFHEKGVEIVEGGQVVEREHEATGPKNKVPGVHATIGSLQELRHIWSHIFHDHDDNL